MPPRRGPISPHPFADSIAVLARRIEHEYPYERLRALPGFEALAREIVQVWRPRPGPDGELSRMLRDSGRVNAGNAALYLDSTPGGLTLARLRDLLAEFGVASETRVRALLVYLRFIGFIETGPPEGRGKPQRYRPTDRLWAAIKTRGRRELEARKGTDPAVDALLARLGEDDVFTGFFVAVFEISIQTARISPPRNDELQLFLDRFEGQPVLYELLQRGDPGDTFPPRGALTFNNTELARLCGASRTQVAGLLKIARAKGYLIPCPDGRERLSENLLNATEMFMALTTIIMVGAAQVALGWPARMYGDT